MHTVSSVLTKDFPIALTLDIDWAPDFVIGFCADILAERGIPATFFATHPSPLLEDLKTEPLFDIGIHPNFLPGTSHGANLAEIMDTMMALVPDAQCMRTHGLYQTSNMFFAIMQGYPQILYDFSLFMPDNHALRPCPFADEGGRSILRIPYQWEDDLYFPRFAAAPNDDFIFETATYQIFDFHPIHIYLNSPHSAHYNKMKNALGKPLSQSAPGDLAPLINKEKGAQTWLNHILDCVPKERFVKACDIVEIVK